MRAMIVLALAASPLALAAPADAQSVIRDGKWVSGQPAPAPTPPPPPAVEEAAPISPAPAPAPATMPDAPLAAPPSQPVPRFAPRAEVVQPVPPAPKPPVARAAVPPAPAPAPGDAGAMPPPPPAAAPVARAEAAPPPPPGATYAPPARPAPVRRADAPPPKPQRAPERRADVPPPPRPHHQAERHADAPPMPHRRADAKPHHAPKHRWGGERDGRWEGGWNAPGGWGAYRRPAQGWSLPRYWWSPEFVVVDYWTYDLEAPSRDDRWVRYYDDAVLVDRHGQVIDWVEGVDWNDGAGHYYADDRDGYYDDFAEGYGPDYAPPGYPAGGYISGGYYYPPAVTHTIRIESEPVVTSRTYVTEEVVTTRGKGGKSYSRVQTKNCNC